MTSHFYTLLDIDKKAEVLWEKGTFLKEVIEYNKYRVNIYELYQFFVGVFYNVKDNKIERIEVLGRNEDELFKQIHLN